MRLDTLALSHHKHMHNQPHGEQKVEEGKKTSPLPMHFSAAVSAHASLKNWQHAKAAMLNVHQLDILKSEKKTKHSAKEKDEDNDDDEDEGGDEEEEKPIEVEAVAIARAMLAIRAYTHWRRFAARKARERQGYSATDRLIGNRDKHMKALLLQEPDVWCFGLTLEDNSIPDDLCDWLEVFQSTEVSIALCEVCFNTMICFI